MCSPRSVQIVLRSGAQCEGRHTFQALALYLVITFHAFPAIWVVCRLGWLDLPGKRNAEFCCDIIAKLLPVSLYLTIANM